MQEKTSKKDRVDRIRLIAIVVLFAITVALSFADIRYSKDEYRNMLASRIVQNAVGSVAAVLIMRRMQIRLFGKPQRLLFLLPCLCIAIDNLPFCSYCNGNMQLVRTQTADMLFFIAYCLSVGIFEECVFRGVIFSVLAGCFSADKKGLWKTYLLSSVLFGAAHLFNGFSAGTLLQVCYSTLTGGLFAFALMKTKNVFCSALVHAVYNFCGLLFDTPSRMGLGSGVVFDGGTVLTMCIVCITVGAFILYSVYKYSEEERSELYQKLGLPPKSDEKTE